MCSAVTIRFCLYCVPWCDWCVYHSHACVRVCSFCRISIYKSVRPLTSLYLFKDLNTHVRAHTHAHTYIHTHMRVSIVSESRAALSRNSILRFRPPHSGLRVGQRAPVQGHPVCRLPRSLSLRALFSPSPLLIVPFRKSFVIVWRFATCGYKDGHSQIVRKVSRRGIDR